MHAAITLNILVLAWLMRTPSRGTTKPQTSGLHKLWDNFKGMGQMMTNDLNFILILVANIFGSITIITIFVHTPNRAISLGIEPKWASFLLSLTAFCALTCRWVLYKCLYSLEYHIGKS
jgi:hypothetical protein